MRLGLAWQGSVWRGATSKANRLGSGFDKQNVCVSMLGVVTDPTTSRSSPTRDFDRRSEDQLSGGFLLHGVDSPEHALSGSPRAYSHSWQ